MFDNGKKNIETAMNNVFQKLAKNGMYESIVSDISIIQGVKHRFS